MLTYKAMYKFLDEGVHAEVLDFPGTITCGDNLPKARQLLASALVDMAETNLMQGKSLPQPIPSCTDSEADLEEPIHLLLTATGKIPQQIVAQIRQLPLKFSIKIVKFLGKFFLLSYL